MKCIVCGKESGTYKFCRSCFEKKERGQIINCPKCGKWHGIDDLCPQQTNESNNFFLYEPKTRILSHTEQNFYSALKQTVPEGYSVFPQINLAAFVERTDNARYRNELFRNIDFLICGTSFEPRIAVEINDSTHNDKARIERDKKVKAILEEAGIPLISLWTSYGTNLPYIKERIEKALTTPVERHRHFEKTDSQVPNPPEEKESSDNLNQKNDSKEKKKGCYVATCVYGSYDCPQVWVLRRYRDKRLNQSFLGRLFVSLYYTFSPTMVAFFGETRLFQRFNRSILDRMVERLRRKGYEDTPYRD